tara:strand:+ start:347 stop:547 length:201 start_codon:yes stop_codon:yes gene_type:complete
MKKIIIFVLSIIFIVSCNQPNPPVKKSKTGICHKAGSQYYNQTKNFKNFTTIEDCIKSGGRLPKRR